MKIRNKIKMKIRKVIDKFYKDRVNLYAILSDEGINISPKAEDAINNYFDTLHEKLEEAVTRELLEDISNARGVIRDQLDSVCSSIGKFKTSLGIHIYEDDL